MSLQRAIIVFDIDGVVRDVSRSYRRALADTVEQFTQGAYRPTQEDIDRLKAEGIWNNDWEGSRELVYRYFEMLGQDRSQVEIDYQALIDFFQSRYRGTDPLNWNGYIATEPLLLQPSYLESLSTQGIAWGFFSGATRGSAEYILCQRLGLADPVLVAMGEAPEKPDPTGLINAVEQLAARHSLDPLAPVIYAGDTVADMYAVTKAKALYPNRTWIGAGILPPHVQSTPERTQAYVAQLMVAGATKVYPNVEQLTPLEIERLVRAASLQSQKLD